MLSVYPFPFTKFGLGAYQPLGHQPLFIQIIQSYFFWFPIQGKVTARWMILLVLGFRPSLALCVSFSVYQSLSGCLSTSRTSNSLYPDNPVLCFWFPIQGKVTARWMILLVLGFRPSLALCVSFSVYQSLSGCLLHKKTYQPVGHRNLTVWNTAGCEMIQSASGDMRTVMPCWYYGKVETLNTTRCCVPAHQDPEGTFWGIFISVDSFLNLSLVLDPYLPRGGV